MAVPTGLAAVSKITISPATVPSAMMTAKRRPDVADSSAEGQVRGPSGYGC